MVCVCTYVRAHRCVRVCANKRKTDGDGRCEIAEKDRRRGRERTSEQEKKEIEQRERERERGRQIKGTGMRHDCHCPEVTCHRPSKRQQHPK